MNRLIQKRRNSSVRSASLKLLEEIMARRESPSPELAAKRQRGLLAILAARRRVL